MTFPEMCEQVRQHFINSVGMESDDAAIRAYKATEKLVDEGYVEEWGMSPDGMPVYVPADVRHPEAVLIFYPRRG